jgi:hypothetical protein
LGLPLNDRGNRGIESKNHPSEEHTQMNRSPNQRFEADAQQRRAAQVVR